MPAPFSPDSASWLSVSSALCSSSSVSSSSSATSQTEFGRPGVHRAVAVDLVVLYRLAGEHDAASPAGLPPNSSSTSSPSLNALDRLAVHRFGLHVEFAEDVLKPGDVLLGLLEVIGQRLGQLLVLHLVDDLGQGFRNRVLGVVDVLERVDEKIL